MTLQQLEYIIALDTHRHFVTAAQHCYVTQPTITLQVQKLEDEIGVQIFNRNKSPLIPTSLGELFISKARVVLQEVNQLKEIAISEKETLDGAYKIGIIPTISPYILPKFIGSFSAKYPQTHLDIDEMQSDTILAGIDKGNIDIGILVTPVNQSFIREIPLYNEPFLFYGAKSTMNKRKKAVNQEDINGLEGLWLLNSGHCFREQVLNICNSPKPQKNINFKSGSIETLKSMVDNYGGFTLIPEMASQKTDMSLTLPFTEPKPIREVSIVTHKSFAKAALIDALRSEIIKVVPSQFETNTKYYKIAWR